MSKVYLCIQRRVRNKEELRKQMTQKVNATVMNSSDFIYDMHSLYILFLAKNFNFKITLTLNFTSLSSCMNTFTVYATIF